MIKRVLALIPCQERAHLKCVISSVLICAGLDFAGLAALLPVLLSVIDPSSSKLTTGLICLGVMGFIIFKNGIITAFTRYQTRYLMRIYRQLSQNLFLNYYQRGLLFLKKRSSVQLGYEVNFICYAYALNILKSLFTLLAEGILSLLLMLGLMVWEPKTGLILILGFTPVFYLYVQIIKKRLRQYGEEEMNVRKEQSRTVVEAFRGFCELEINQAFPNLMGHFQEGLETIGKCRIRVETVQKMPQFLSEVALVFGLGLLLLTSQGNLTLVSGVFAVAAFRLIPSIRGLMSSWTTIQNYLFCLDTLEDGLTSEKQVTKDISHKPLTFKHEIRLEKITFGYPDGTRNILENFSCCILKGERIGIKGSSGSGKSTLFNIMLGFFPLSEGTMWIDNEKLEPENMSQWHELIGYVPQEVFIMKGTLAQNITMGENSFANEEIWEILEQVKLKEWAQELPQGLDTDLGEYGSRISGGQKQRIGIARALYKKAQVLFLDEATSALDNQTETEINQTLQYLSETRRELTLIIIAHRESSLSFCDRILEIENE